MSRTVLFVAATLALFRLPAAQTGHSCSSFKSGSGCLVIAGCRALDSLGNLAYYQMGFWIRLKIRRDWFINRKEANEIKKSLTPADYAITRTCGCCVDVGKNKKMELKETFLLLQEEGVFKYFTIFRSALPETIGKDLINVESPLYTEVEGGAWHFLLKLGDSQLKDDAILEEPYDKVIAACDYDENYYIILIHCTYDIPTKATSGMKVFDASDYVYEFIQYTICSVKPSRAKLCYNSLTNTIEDRDRDQLVEAPVQGFLFPVFNDRNTDIHSPLYYAKSLRELPDILIGELSGRVIPISVKSQKETFQIIVEETLGEGYDFETVKNIHKNLSESVEKTKDEPVPLTLDKYQVGKLLETNGATPEKLEELKQRYAQVGDGPGVDLVAVNVVNTRSFEIKTPDVSIKVSPDKTYLMENRMIEGWPCIIIAINEHVEINGITVRPVAVSKGGEGEDVPFQDMPEQAGIESGEQKGQIQKSLS